jgi:hypothetical protein
MLRGQGICRELLWPKLVVVDSRVVLTASRENVLAQRSDVPANSVTIFAPLDDRLSTYRTHFKSVRADPFEPTLYVTLDPTLEPVKATTLLATAAHAGYSHSRITTAGVELEVDWWLPPPPSDATARPSLCIEPREKGFTLRVPPEGAPAESSGLETLGADIASACAGRAPCADVIGIGERDGATFGDLARVAAAALGSAAFKGQHPRLVFVTRAPVDASTPASARLAKRPCAR